MRYLVLTFLTSVGFLSAVFPQNANLKIPVVEIISAKVGLEESGAGFIIGESGNELFLLTAEHVIADAAEISLSFWESGTINATVVNKRSDYDVAVIKCKIPDGFEVPNSFGIAETDPFKGQNLILIGHPYGEKWDVNDRNEVIDVIYDHNPLKFSFSRDGIQPGSSGGPILNSSRELLGMTLMVNPSKSIGIKSHLLVSLLSEWSVPVNLLVGVSIGKNVADQELTRYKLFIQEAVTSYNIKDWVKAKDSYEKAYHLISADSVKEKIKSCEDYISYDSFFNQGLKTLDDPEKALTLYKKAQSFQNTPAVRERITRMEELIERKLEFSNTMLPDSYIEELAGEMVLVRGGTFEMGSKEGENDEKPVREITLNDFFMGKYEVTNQQFANFLTEMGNQSEGDKTWYQEISEGGDNVIFPSSGKYYVARGYENYPVMEVSWYGAMAFCEWLSKKTGVTYRLPTEAEWEFAAIGGSKSKETRYSGGNLLSLVAWYGGNSDGGVHRVGSKEPNELGIHDMSGNVREWCSDWYGKYNSRQKENPQGEKKGDKKVIRGGSFNGINLNLRLKLRESDYPSIRFVNIGFRVVREI